MTLMPQDGSPPLSVTQKIQEALRLSSKTPRDIKNFDGGARDSAGNRTEEGVTLLKEYDEIRKNQELASWVDTQLTACKNARVPFERQWYLNLAFYNGRHYVQPVTVSGSGFRLTSPKAPSWRVRLVVNKIRTAVRTECSKLSSSRPIPTVVPATGEDADFSAAKIAENLLQSAFAHADFQRTYRNWIWWGSVTGCAYLKSYWDSTADDLTLMKPAEPMVGMDGQPVIDPKTGQPVLKAQEPVKGRIKVERVTPFHVYVPDLLTEDLDEQPYVIHVMTRSPEWVQSAFGIKPTCDTRASSSIMEASYLVSKGSEEHLDSVLVKEMWLKKGAHKDFPEGGLLTIINDKVVQKLQKWPWPFPEYPFYKYDGIPTGSYYSDSVVVDLIPLNKEYNKTRSQSIEIKNTMGKPKLLYQQGSLNPRQISSEPGQAIPYKAGFQPPEVIPAAEVPVSMLNELDRLTTDFDDISGQHEISRGGTPPQVTSGTAIAFLQEQDDTKLSYQIASIEGAIEKLGKHYLKYVSTYWDEPRLIRISGKDNEFEARLWKGSDLRGNTDVKVQTGSALPVSKAARQAMITEFMQNGWIDPSTGMEILDMGGFEKIMNELLMDKKQAQRENLKMAEMNPEEVRTKLSPPVGDGMPTFGPNGETLDPTNNQPFKPEPPLPVNSWDNHEAHIQYHDMFRKSQEFELLDDAIKEAFELHVQMHKIAMVSPQQGELGMIANDPNAPVTDPETGMQMPNPLAEQQEAQPDPAQEALGEQQVASGQQDMSLKQEAHDLKMQAAQEKTVRETEKHRQDLQIKADKAAMARSAMIQKMNEKSGPG